MNKKFLLMFPLALIPFFWNDIRPISAEDIAKADRYQKSASQAWSKDESIDLLNKAVALNPRDPELYYDLASKYYDRSMLETPNKDNDKIIAACDKALRYNNKNALTNNQLIDIAVLKCRAYNEIHDYNKALDSITAAKKIPAVPDKKASVYTWLGHTYKSLKQYDKSLNAYNDAITANSDVKGLRPMLGLAYYNRAELYKSLNEKDKALADYTAAILCQDRGPMSFYYSARGSLLKDYFGDEAKAIKDFEKALEIYPSDKEARKQLDILRNKKQG